MFPWRISAVLVPVATAVILANVAALFPDTRPARMAAGSIIVALAGGGIWVMAAGIGYGTDKAEEDLLEYRPHSRGSERCLPAPGQRARGRNGPRNRIHHLHAAAATEAGVEPHSRRSPALPAVTGRADLRRFQIGPVSRHGSASSGSHRMRRCEAWYDGNWSALGRAQELRDAGITHIVAPACGRSRSTGFGKSTPTRLVYRLSG